MILKIIQKNIKKGPAPYEAKSFRSGFALLFAIVLVSIILSITIGIMSVSFREIMLSTSGKNANDAFFAADTGIECALLLDKDPSIFPANLPPNFITHDCAGVQFKVGIASDVTFTVPDLGFTNACAKVFVKKVQDDTGFTAMKIISKGYNVSYDSNNMDCPGTNQVERELEVNY